MKLRFLHWSPKGRVARNGVFSLTQSIIGVGTYFIVMRHVVNVAGLEGVGIWSLTMGFVAFVRVMDLTGGSGLARMVAINTGDEATQATYIDTATLLIIVLYALLTLVAFFPLQHALGGIVHGGMRPLAHELLIWAMISLPINVAGVAQLSAIDGVGRADVRSILNIAGFAAYGISAAILVPSEGIIGLAYAQLIQYVLILLWARAILVWRVAPLRILPTQFSRTAAAVAIHYDFRLQSSTIPMVIFDPLTRIFLGRWIGLDFLGIYDMAYKLAGNTRTLIQASMNPLVPEFSRLYQTDVDQARSYHAYFSEKSIRAVALSFSILIITAPLFSLFLFSRISTDFIFSVAVLSFGWGIASFGLATQLYARAAGVLRWSIAGQWGLLILGGTLVYLVSRAGDGILAPVAVATAVCMGHVIAFIGETTVLRLTPFRLGKARIVTLSLAAGFILFASCAALLTMLIASQQVPPS